jgi:hypothetical protein
MPSQVRIALAVTARRPQSSRLDPAFRSRTVPYTQAIGGANQAGWHDARTAPMPAWARGYDRRVRPAVAGAAGHRGGQPTRCSAVLFLRWAAAD